MKTQSSETPGTLRDTKIIFVTGASRSGTTMLNRVLSNHSKVLGLNELHYFGDLWDIQAEARLIPEHEAQGLAAKLYARQAHGLWGPGPTKVEYQKAGRLLAELPADERTGIGVFSAVVDELASTAGKQMSCEQTPRNIFYAERLLEVYPNAYVVHMIRDPRAVLASQKNRWKLRRLGGNNVPFSELVRTWFNYHPLTMCRLWVNSTAEALRLAEHPRFKNLRFEDLVASPDEYVRELCNFLEIVFEPEMLAVPQWGSSNIHHRIAEKGISQDVLNQWDKVLTEGELAICEHMAKSYMERFSYAPKSTRGFSIPAIIPSLLRYPVHVGGVMLTNPRRAWIQLKALFQSKYK